MGSPTSDKAQCLGVRPSDKRFGLTPAENKKLLIKTTQNNNNKRPERTASSDDSLILKSTIG